MALPEIINKIRQDSATAVKDAESAFEKESALALAGFEQEEKLVIERAKEKAAVEAARFHDQLIARAQSDAAMKVLSGRRDALEKVFVEAEKRLRSYSDDDKRKLFAGLFAKIGIKEGTLMVAKNDTALNDPAFLAEIKKIVPDAELKLTPGNETNGGFILESGRARYVSTIDSLLFEARENLADMLVQKLFGTARGN